MQRPFRPIDMLDRWLLQAVIAGAAFALLLPFAQAQTVFGWLPLWLVGLPLSAWLGRRGLLALQGADQKPVPVRGRRRLPPVQARRRRPSRLNAGPLRQHPTA